MKLIVFLLISITTYSQKISLSTQRILNTKVDRTSFDSLRLAVKKIKIPKKEGIYIEDYGAIPNDGLDDSKAIKAALDFAQGGDVYIGVGKFNANFTIGSSTSFKQINLIGSGAAYDANMKGTIIYGHIKMQGLRRSLIKGITLIGSNPLNPGNGVGMLNGDNYGKDSRYATDAAISIDEDKDGYKSSGITIQDCIIEGYVTGIVSALTGGDGNGDFITVDNCNIRKCKWGVSIGQSQARMTAITNCNFNLCFTAICTDVHGMQSGRVNIVDNCDFSGYQMLSISNMAFNGSLFINKCYGEDLYIIGWIGNDNSNAAIPFFTSCDFNFNHKQINSTPAAIITGYRATFQNCRFAGLTTASNIWGTGIWNNCTFQPAPTYKSSNKFFYCTTNDFQGNEGVLNVQ